MKALFSFVCFALFSISLAAQYQVGVPVYDTIYTGNYHRIEDCTPDEDVSIGLDDPLLDFVTGLELVMIIEEINVPQGILSTSSGALAVNDSLTFNSTNTFYPFYFSSDGNFRFSIIAKGTPEVENEAYPCNLIEFISQVVCESGYIITPDIFFEDCIVEEATITNTHSPSELNAKISTFPNPANSTLNIQFENTLSLTSLTLLNSSGIQVLAQRDINATENLELDISTLSSGIYFLKISVEDQFIVRKIVIN